MTRLNGIARLRADLARSDRDLQEARERIAALQEEIREFRDRHDEPP